MTQVCKHCESIQVARCKWVNPNTNEIYHNEEFNIILEWCMNCKSETIIIEDDSIKAKRKIQVIQFDEMSFSEQLKFMIENKKHIVIYLDNDDTFFTFKEDEQNEDEYETFTLHYHFGDSVGVEQLLKTLDFEVEHV